MFIQRIFITSIFSLIFTGAVWTQDDWHTYPFRELSVLVGQEETLYQSNDRKGEIVISARPFPAKTRLVFTGSKRAIAGHTKNFIRIWFETRGVPVEKADLLVDEFLFKEKDKEHWIPVLKSVTPSMENSLKPGDEIIAYYFYLGGFNGKALNSKRSTKETSTEPTIEGIRWIFTVEKFEKPNGEFKIQSLAGVIESSTEAALKADDIWYYPSNIKTKVKVRFTGDVREVAGKRKRLRDLWFDRMGFSEGASGLMQFEAKFIEDGKEYWIAVRNRTLEQMQENVKKDESLYLNSILAGGIKDKGKIDWFFVAGEYSTF